MMQRFGNKLRLTVNAAAIVGVFLTLTTGCESAQVEQQPEQGSNKIKPADAESLNLEKQDNEKRASTQASSQAIATPAIEPEWIGETVALFDGKTLEGWETIEFGGEGRCTTTDGVMNFEAGDPFTGISATSDHIPKTNYEISLEARKIQGTDFFCGFTFPVAESHCTLIVGGWGGATVGLSCIDDQDASRNATCKYMKFEKEQWYKIRIRVQPKNISVWIDETEFVNQNIEGKKISLRGDTELCKPMGICSFMTVAEYRNIKRREFKPMETSAESESELPETKSGTADKK